MSKNLGTVEGLSAYEIWLDTGHTGSEDDFLEWLKGQTGSTPDITATAHGLPYGNSPTSDVTGTPENPNIDFGIPAGEPGTNGKSVIWKGELSDPPADPEINWAYYNTTENKSLIWNGLAWDTMAEGSGGIPDAPKDGKDYLRKNGQWIDAGLDSKLDKVDIAAEFDRAYVVTPDGDQTMYDVDQGAASPDTIPRHGSYGELKTADPQQDEDAASKKYVDSLMTPQGKQYLDTLISTGALERIYWSVVLTTTQTGSITTDRVYLQIVPDPLITDGNWSITHDDGSVLERAGKKITYTNSDGEEVLSDEDGNVLEDKFHIPPGIEVTKIKGNPSDDINNVRITVEFDVHSLREVIGDTDSLDTTSKVVVIAINEVLNNLSRINAGDRFIGFDPNTGWEIGLTNDTHGGHIRLLDKNGSPFLDVDVAAYGSGLEAVFSIDFIGGEFNPAESYAQGDRAHHRKAATLTGWPKVTECTLAYVAKNEIPPGAWNEDDWDLRNDLIEGMRINTFAQIARDGFIFVASRQMDWDHEPTLDEFTQNDWFLINRPPVIPGKFAIFMLDNSVGQVGWLAADELAPFRGTGTIDIDAQGNISVILNTNCIIERTASGLLLAWNENNGVLTLGSDTARQIYTKGKVDSELAKKMNVPNAQSANSLFAGPESGNGQPPGFRKLVAADIPNLNVSKLTDGVLAKARGGTGNANGTADKLTTARKISITGSAVGEATFDGSKDIAINIKASASGSGLVTLSGFGETTVKVTNFFNGFKQMYTKVIVQQSDWGGNGGYAEILFKAGDSGAGPSGTRIYGALDGMTFWRDGVNLYVTYTRAGQGKWNAIFVFATVSITIESGATKPSSATQITVS